jgi:AraC-like DNA-binding protein
MNYIRIFLFFLVFFFPFLLFSQSQTKESERRFDSIYYNAADISVTDVDRALKIADSLYLHSKTDLQKLRCLMLSAMFYQTKGTSDKTIEYAFEAEKIAIKIKDYNWQARILGFLATEFNNIGILKEREELINRMGEIVPKIPDDLQRSLMYPMYYQERAIFYLENKNDIKGWEYINLAEEHLLTLPDSHTKFMLLGLNDRLHGNFFLKLKSEPDSALVYYERSEDYYEKAENLGSYSMDVLYSGIGQAYLMKGQDSLGLVYLKKAQQLSEEAENIPLNLEIYEVLSDYYKEKGETQKYVYYLEKYQELHRLTQNQKIKPVIVLLESLKQKNQDLSYSRTYLIGLSVLLALGIVLSFIWYRKKRKKDYQRYQEIIAELKQNGFVSTNSAIPLKLVDDEPEHEGEIEKRGKPRISEEAEQKIIEGLKVFEKTDNFRNANYALADLASEIGVNTKYLSQVLNSRYGRDFNTYINELRINYIIEKLKTDSDYHLYKLSFLAEECGFSSHSKFSSVFKSVTGLTPTRFMSYLKEEKGISA